MRLYLALAPLVIFGCRSKEDSPVPLSNVPALLSASVPPIDAAAPANIETATFALG